MPMRSEPAHRAEQVNQVLFGERAEIIEINENDWARIRCELDGYEGWCKAAQLTFISRKEYRKELRFLAEGHQNKLVFDESDMWLPMGCDLWGLKSGKINGGKYKGKKLSLKKATAEGECVKMMAMEYMNAPYQWGGRTVAGIDCSGLVQMAYKLCGMHATRDAATQANEGEPVDFLQHAVCGDLAFFDNKEGRITHVGILLDEQTIIHATDTSGRVVIDRIDQGGIISIGLKKRTHNLRMVRRLIG